MSNPSTSQFNSGEGGTYNYHHGRQPFPGDLHNPSPNYYHPNPPGTGHTIGLQGDGLIGTQAGGGHSYSIGPLGRNGSGPTIGSPGDIHTSGGGGHPTGSQGRGGRTYT
ncbi:hypothetical protein PSTG_19264, partial [Puccinia striiformis f. sp. tritici PST-78]